MLTVLTLLSSVVAITSADCFHKKFPMTFGSLYDESPTLYGHAFTSDGYSYMCGLTQDDEWTDEVVRKDLLVPFVVVSSPTGYLQWGKYIRESRFGLLEAATTYLSCQLTQDEKHLIYVYETEEMPNVLALTAENGDLVLSQKLGKQSPLTSKPLIAGFDFDNIFIILNANYDDEATSSIFKMEPRDRNFKIDENYLLSTATKASAISLYPDNKLLIATQQADTINGGEETNAVIFFLDAESLEKAEYEEEGVEQFEDQWLLNNIEEVHEFIHYFNDTDYLEEEFNDTVTIMIATSEGALAPDSVIRKSDSVDWHSQYQVTEDDLSLNIAAISPAQDSEGEIQYLLILGYYKLGLTGNFYLLKQNAFDAYIMQSHVLEGFDIGLYNQDTSFRMFNHYDPNEEQGFVLFGGSWTLFGIAPFRYALFKIHTSPDLFIEEIKETRQEIRAAEEERDRKIEEREQDLIDNCDEDDEEDCEVEFPVPERADRRCTYREEVEATLVTTATNFELIENDDFIALEEFGANVDNSKNSDYYVGVLDLDFRDVFQYCQNFYIEQSGNYTVYLNEPYRYQDFLILALDAEEHNFVTAQGLDANRNRYFFPDSGSYYIYNNDEAPANYKTVYYLEVCVQNNLRVFEMTDYNLADPVLKYVKAPKSYIVLEGKEKYDFQLPDIEGLDDPSFAYENVTIHTFPDDYTYLLNEADKDVDPVYWASALDEDDEDIDTDRGYDEDEEDTSRLILIRPEKLWYNQIFVVNITLGATEKYELLSNYSVTFQVKPENEKDDILFRALTYTIKEVTNEQVVKLHFSRPLNRKILLGDEEGEERRMLLESTGLNQEDIQIQFQGQNMTWELYKATSKEGIDFNDNVSELWLKLILPKSQVYSYQPFKEDISVKIMNPDKFISIENFKIEFNDTMSKLPAYTQSLGAETDSMESLGHTVRLLPFLFLLAHIICKFKYGANLSHSYFSISFIQNAALFALYGIDLYPNSIAFWKEVFQYALFREAVIERDISTLTINSAFVKNLMPLEIPKEFTFHFSNIVLHTLRAVGPLVVAKLVMSYLIKRAKKQENVEKVEKLKDNKMKLDAFFLHDYWMRLFSLLFLPTLLFAWIQVNYEGKTLEQFAGFGLSIVVLVILFYFVSYAFYRSNALYSLNLQPDFIAFHTEDMKRTKNSLNSFYFPFDLLRKAVMVYLIRLENSLNMQVFYIFVLSSFFITFIVTLRPFKTRMLNSHAIYLEVTTFIVILIFSQLDKNHSPEANRTLGDFVAAITFIFTLISCLFVPIDCYQQWKDFDTRVEELQKSLNAFKNKEIINSEVALRSNNSDSPKEADSMKALKRDATMVVTKNRWVGDMGEEEKEEQKETIKQQYDSKEYETGRQNHDVDSQLKHDIENGEEVKQDVWSKNVDSGNQRKIMSKQERRSTMLKGLLEEKEQDLPESRQAIEVIKTMPMEEGTFTKRTITDIEKQAKEEEEKRSQEEEKKEEEVVQDLESVKGGNEQEEDQKVEEGEEQKRKEEGKVEEGEGVGSHQPTGDDHQSSQSQPRNSDQEPQRQTIEKNYALTLNTEDMIQKEIKKIDEVDAVLS